MFSLHLETTRCFKTYSEWNKRTQSQCLKKSWALFEECWRGKKMEIFRLLPTQSTWCCYATSNTAKPCSSVFSHFEKIHIFHTFTFLLQHQYLNSCRTEEVKSKNKFIPSGQAKNVFKLPLSKGAKPLANHSFKNVWLTQKFYESILKIDLKNWTLKILILLPQISCHSWMLY